ncbi:MAG: hypothetical protein KDB24_11650 [Microthrixaceae bacterium]|nr:hypothetical protein [Microthrixaceae bacterium]
MSEPKRDPFDQNWTTPPEGVGADASTLALELAAWEVADLECYRADLHAAIVELAASGGGAAWCDADDPVVVMLQALGVLCRNAPDASSASAARLIGRLGDRPRPAIDLSEQPHVVSMPHRRRTRVHRGWATSGAGRPSPA